MPIINILWKNCSFKYRNSDSTSKKVCPHFLFLAHFILNSIIMQQRDALFWELRRKFTLALIIMTSLSSPKNRHNVARILLKLKLRFNIYFFTIPKPSLKIRTANAIFWIYLGIFGDYGLKNIFLGIKLFLFLKIEH